MIDLKNPPPALAAALARMDESLAPFEARAATPEGRGWLRLAELLRAAAADPMVRESRPASDFAELVCELAADALTARSLDDALEPLASVQAAMRAKLRHAATEAARHWVLSEWAAHADAYKRNKSAFGADYAPRCKREHGADVRERTIRETWLKGL